MTGDRGRGQEGVAGGGVEEGPRSGKFDKLITGKFGRFDKLTTGECGCFLTSGL